MSDEFAFMLLLAAGFMGLTMVLAGVAIELRNIANAIREKKK